MVFEFIFLYRRLNLFFLSLGKRQKVVKKSGLIHTKVVEIIEYEKNNDGYWDKAKLY